MFAVIYTPNFLLQAVLRHEPGLYSKPAALVDASPAKTEIVQVSPSGSQYGIHKGMTASQAMARYSELIIKCQSAAQDRTTRDLLLQTAYAFSPSIEATAPGVCTMDISRLRIDGEAALQEWARQLRARFTQFNIDARIGIATTPALALLAARRENPISILLQPGDFIGSLPLEAIEPPAEAVALLHRWGIKTVGAFLALGKDRLAERFDPAILELFERVSPHSIRPLHLVAQPEEYVEQMDFEHEIETIEPLLFVLRRFVEQLSQRLATTYLVMGGLRLQLDLASGAKYEHTFRIPCPTGNVATLFRTLCTHLENVRTDSPIVSLQLSATSAMPTADQLGFFETILRNPNQFSETLARLSALCGRERVGTPVLESTHEPDRFRMTKPEFRHTTQPVKKSAGLQLRRFRPARRVSVEFRNEKPSVIRSQDGHGAITDIQGPFLSSGNWWEQNKWAREEWDIQTMDGAMYRIFRCSDGVYLEGMYD